MPSMITNNATSKLASSLTTTSTSFAVLPGDGAKFPAPTAGNWFPVTLVKPDGTIEIVKCTARNVDTLTVARAQEGTPAATWAAGDRAELRMTAATIKDGPITDATQAALDAKPGSSGAGASGTWNISISGNAATATNATNAAGATNAGYALNAGHATTAGSAAEANTAKKVICEFVDSAVKQVGDIGNAFNQWNLNAVPAMQIDAPQSGNAYMVWRATRWGFGHLAAMHVYEAGMTVTLRLNGGQTFTWNGSGEFLAPGQMYHRGGVPVASAGAPVTRLTGVVEFGRIPVQGFDSATLDIPDPYVMVGLRYAGEAPDFIYLRGCQFAARVA